jgi:hypothetical protein
MMKCSNLAGLVEGFFIERLMAQRRASPQTISSSGLRLQDLDASFLSGFLDHLERDRHNTEAGTPAWQPFTRSSATRLCNTQSTAP